MAEIKTPHKLNGPQNNLVGDNKMFVTFYSYKGGVGRSMALANIACLLVEDVDHPQRVLIWDFDLEAPGMLTLFPPRNPQKYGFVDMAYEYIETGEVPDVRNYIYTSAVTNVDVLPAGTVDESYCNKLQHINWAGYFTSDTKNSGPFFGPLVEMIKKQDYDYVLIDSRTGLNDQAGICTELLPDLLVILFRLTDQNFDGLEHVVPAIRHQLKMREKDDTIILPIASAVPSNTSSMMRKKRDKAKKVFDKKDINYIRFDPDLTCEEYLFCLKDKSKDIWPCAPIVEDYEYICSAIRKNNESDTRTAVGALKKQISNRDSASAKQILIPLIKKKSQLKQLWDILNQLSEEEPSRKQELNQVVDSILDKDKCNSYAYEWKAKYYFENADSPKSKILEQAMDSIRRALDYSPDKDKVSIYRFIRKIASCTGDLEEAVAASRQALKLLPDNAQILLDTAMLQMRRGANYFASAIDLLEEMPDEIGQAKFIPMVYLQAVMGQHDKADALFNTLKNHLERQDLIDLFEAHLCIIKGDISSGQHIAEKSISSNKLCESDCVNWAEFFLCAENFDRSLEIAKSCIESIDDSVSNIDEMSYLVEYIAGKETQAEKVLNAWKYQPWNFRELIIFRERMIQENKEKYLQQLHIIEDLIRQSELI
ncbi:MAG: KGGVGR-motif variant AAA ATPase [Planctomycetota bacterium]|jgi:cellulose biosynthesis protein BcsQ